MKDDLSRRDFLKVAGFAVSGIAAAATLRAQEQDPPVEPDEDAPNDDEDLFGSDGSQGDGDEEETRACPQCGALMYKDGNTWICETCGYSYVE